MKKLLYILSASILLGLSSCDEDFMDTKSPDQLTGDSFWRNVSDAEAGLAAAYSQMECATSYWGFAEIKFPVEMYPSDLVRIGGDAYNYEDWLSIYNFNVNSANTQTTSYWNIHYKGINFANQVIEKVGEMTEEQIDQAKKNEIIAEAHFLRGYYHLKLLLAWEKIIVRDAYPKGLSDIDKALSERTECWDFIVADFAKAAATLPGSYDSANVGRVTKWAAYAYLGKANLYRAGEESANSGEYYNAAKTAFAEVVNSNNFSLVDNFISMFDGTNQNSSEAVLELQLSNNTDNGAWFKFPHHRWIKPKGLYGWDEIAGSAFLLEEFKKEGKVATDGRYDHRLYGTLFFDDDYFNDSDNPRVYGYTFREWWDASSTAYDYTGFRKYLPSTREELDAYSHGNNMPLMRYADVLLMYAETLNELNETAAAIPHINNVRAMHGGLPAMTGTDKAAVTAQIEHERICEFAMEGSRFHDLRRWGKLNETMAAHGRSGVTDASHFFPIPESEANSNNNID
ncbi:RagB/SusD family nutrient uptake outer membrane protein [Marinifilum caeruleilacunae]|uniref:RagB/SusD family nutrient uptake outer membrane protein n=1 Tax=Marinifilum caeruleilacunae TaxID=2499076 RepID=A0ABX1WWY1_9BACT|nr:RagB/SusD family nutrient uptake outer membrane protein [Marinifilum caeruleilacunae]NOU60380.1 RagB/SusD family nutrient uptake outer membrane protein [Marinifilum caeruleilacunae]